MLPKDTETIKDIWRKRISRIAVVLFVFSILYYGREVYWGNEELSIKEFLFGIYDDGWNSSYWYLYAYIQMLITLPFLRILAKNLEDRYYYYLFALVTFFAGILPVFEYILWRGSHSLNNQLRIGWLATNIVFYPLMGYFLQYRIKHLEKKGKLILTMWILNILAIALCCYATYLRAITTGECSEGKSQLFHNSLVMVNTATIFLSIKYFFIKFETMLPKYFLRMISSVGSCTFGIYLWHILVLGKIRDIQDVFRGSWGLNYMVSALLLCLCVMAVCYGMTWMMKKIPVMKKLV